MSANFGWTARLGGTALLCVAFIAGSVAVSSPLAAQPAPSQPKKPARGHSPEGVSLARLGDQMNANTLAVISGNVNGTYLTMAYDMAAVLNDGDNLRILPVVGHGGGHNIRDVRFLRGIDLGITQSNILDVYRRTGELGPIDDKITYIAKLFNDEMHIVVRRDVTSVEQLRGKKVSFNEIGSNTDISGRDIFQRLGIAVQGVNMGQADGLQALKIGEIAAMMQMTGKPTRAVANIKASDGFRLLPVPFAKPLQTDYLPAVFTHDDYPQLIAPGESIDAIAGGGVLIAYNWPKNSDRYRRIEKFVEAFFPRIEEFKKAPRHPKWKEASLTATIPGMMRFPAAQAWLDRHQPHSAQASMRDQFDQFVSTRGGASSAPRSAMPESERERLFQEFLKWRQSRETR
jgi:TRAP transporter TAXI family solute receptor